MRMSDPVVVVIGHPDGTEGVQLSVFGRERPSTDTDDVNWLRGWHQRAGRRFLRCGPRGLQPKNSSHSVPPLSSSMPT